MGPSAVCTSFVSSTCNGPRHGLGDQGWPGRSMSAAWQRFEIWQMIHVFLMYSLSYNLESINTCYIYNHIHTYTKSNRTKLHWIGFMWLHQFHHSQYIAFFFKWISFSSWSCSGPEMSRVTPDVTYGYLRWNLRWWRTRPERLARSATPIVSLKHKKKNTRLCMRFSLSLDITDITMQLQRSWIPNAVVHVPKQNS